MENYTYSTILINISINFIYQYNAIFLCKRLHFYILIMTLINLKQYPIYILMKIWISKHLH